MVKRKATAEVRLRNKSPQAREEKAQNLIIEFLDRNLKGSTVKQIMHSTGVSRTTVVRHLERLVALRHATKRDFGYVSIYYKGGYIDEETSESEQFSNDTSFAFQLVNKQPEGNFIYVQERQLGDLREEKVTGGIMINTKDAKKFIGILNAYTNKAIDLESRI